MCGIAGVRRFDSEPVGRELLANMAAQLTVIQNLPVEDEVSMPASACHRLLRP